MTKRYWTRAGTNMPPWWQKDRFLAKLGEAKGEGEQARKVPANVHPGPSTDFSINDLSQEFN